MKRVFDILLSAIGLVVLSPLFAICALCIKTESRGPVFYVQQRVGRDFKPFNLYKFRTMVKDASGPSVTAGGDRRITKVGRVLRKTKLDELPQFMNVLKGDMSFVGPRPEVLEFVRHFQGDYREILRMRPGITDYASIEFRSEEEILGKYPDPEDAYVKEILPAKITLYKKYLQDRGMVTDMKILIKTLWKILQ